jgi:acyl-phosphate glycerol 3-phosphate acyltransferase
MHDLLVIVTIVAGYLIGGIPFGYLIGRWRGINIFQHGSGNIGATNVGRVLGKRFGILVFLLDFAKGAAPVALALWIQRLPLDLPKEDVPLSFKGLGVWAGLAAFLGHLFPIYIRFRGGKGVATGAGVVCVLMPIPALGALITWLAVVMASRYVSLASLSAVIALCVLQLALTRQAMTETDLITTSFCFLAAALVWIRHRSNILRLMHGTENRLPENSAMFSLSKTIHVLALGYWFGSTAFFVLIVGVSLFDTFKTIGATSPRPAWFPLAEEFRKQDKHIDGHIEQGSRAFGAAVGPLFPWFFLLQGICGFLAVGTCLGWTRSQPAKIHRLRAYLLLAALITVLIGWAVGQKVEKLRLPRNQATDAYLIALPGQADSLLPIMESARADFTGWHFYSLGLSFVTLLLVTAAMALAARLPAAPVIHAASPNGAKTP